MIEKEFELKRKQLVEFMKTRQAVTSMPVEKAFLKVKRELFVLPELLREAYSDTALPIGFGQTISQPSTIAIMLELLNAQEEQNVLEVGAGCGYVLTLLSEIVGKKGKVFGIDLVEGLYEKAKENLKKTGSKNIELMFGDGSLGWKEKAPFDRILLSAACPFIPKPLFDQLKEGGKIVAPVGDKFTQSMQVMQKINSKPVKSEPVPGYFVFVPLRGEHGWK